MMTTTISKKLLRFARTHDWGEQAYLNMYGALVVYDECEERDVEFTTFEALLAWAGY